MNNNQYDSFFWLSVIANICQLDSWNMNKAEVSNDEIMRKLLSQDKVLDLQTNELQIQTNEYLRKIVKQNELIISQNEEIIDILANDKCGGNDCNADTTI